MPSPARQSYIIVAEARASALVEIVRDGRLRPLERQRARTFLHAGLATYVAGWDSYLKALVENFFVVSAQPLNAAFAAHHSLLESLKDEQKARFTPNAENSRKYLFSLTGYDPIGDWVWPQRSMGAVLVRERLNEILRVRHSFAHGHGMPAYGWNTASSGEARLTTSILSDTAWFFGNLVLRTDKGLSRHLLQAYGIDAGWY